MNQTWCLASWSSHSQKEGKPISNNNSEDSTLH